MEWSTVSKAADKSRRMSEVTSPRSIARMRSLWILRRVVSVVQHAWYVVCRVHSSNQKYHCVLCNRTVHKRCICTDDNLFYCHYCLAESLPFLNIVDDREYYGMFSIQQHSLKEKVSDLVYPRLNLNPYNTSIDSKFINNEFIDADINHYNTVYGQSCDYSDTDQLNKILPNQLSTNLQSIVHFNVRSIVANLDSIYSNLKMLSHKFSIIAVTETWTDSSSEDRIEIPGYGKIIKSRDILIASRGGGVAIFYSLDLAVNVKVRADLSCPDNNIMESLFIQISHNNLSVKDIIIGVVYRRPGTNLTNFNEHFAALLEKINLESRPTYILFDFNIDLLNSNTCNQLFLNDLSSSGFFPSYRSSNKNNRWHCNIDW